MNRASSDRYGTVAMALVSGVATAFGTMLLVATGYLEARIRADPTFGGLATVQLVLAILTALLFGVALFVAALVTANTAATVVAGRTRRIALLRLLGSSAGAQRAAIAREGLVAGAIGAASGLVIATLVALAGIPLLEVALHEPASGYVAVRPILLAPPLIAIVTTALAAWAGSRRVLTVSPLQALAGSGDASRDEVVRRPVRHGLALTLGILGLLLLAGGVAAGTLSPFGVVVAFGGGVLSFSGLVAGAALLLPPLLRGAGRLFGRSVAARLAASQTLRASDRTSRAALGVVIGVTLVTMFAVATETVKAVLASATGERLPDELVRVLDGFGAVMSALVAVSAVIAAIGLVNLLVLGIVQRRRELGLLRTLGVSRGQVRGIVGLEAAQLAIVGVVGGLVLGTLYGWAGALATFGSVATAPGGTTFVAPALPLAPLATVVAAAVVVTIVAALVPARLATRVTPIAALAAS